MKVEAIEDSKGLGTDDALISAIMDLFSATMVGTGTKTRKPTGMWPTVEAYPAVDDPVVLAMWAAEYVFAGYTIVFIASSQFGFFFY